MISMLKGSRGFNRVAAGAAAAVAVAIAFGKTMGKTNVDNCDFTEQCLLGIADV